MMFCCCKMRFVVCLVHSPLIILTLSSLIIIPYNYLISSSCIVIILYHHLVSILQDVIYIRNMLQSYFASLDQVNKENCNIINNNNNNNNNNNPSEKTKKSVTFNPHEQIAHFDKPFRSSRLSPTKPSDNHCTRHLDDPLLLLNEIKSRSASISQTQVSCTLHLISSRVNLCQVWLTLMTLRVFISLFIP